LLGDYRKTSCLILSSNSETKHYQLVQKFKKETAKKPVSTKMSTQSSKRSAKRAAMNRFKNNRRNGLNVLDDDAGHFKEEEDIYDLVDQEEYKNLVESRRQREDFVVDDGRSFINNIAEMKYTFLSLSNLHPHFFPFNFIEIKRRNWLL
jgi:type IV secretory pathway VirB10-like protein